MNQFTHTIRFKIILAFGVCIVFMVAIGVFGVYGLSRLNSNMSDSYSGNLMPIAQLSDTRAAQLNIRAKIRRMQAARSQATVSQTMPSVETDLADMDKAWNAYYPAGISSDKERDIAERLARDLTDFRKQINDIVSALNVGNFDNAGELIDKSFVTADAVTKGLADDAALNVAQASQFENDSDSVFRATRWIAIALVTTGVFVATGVSIYLLRAISSPLARAVNVAHQIAGGRLENQITIDLRGEFGQLLDALNKMDEQLSETVRGIKASTESVAVASREIASGNIDLSARTEEQAASLEETASSMTQLTETVKQNADNARQANALATRATDMADAGNDAVQGMVGTIGQISSSSARISEITSTIEGIAFQTNILALNAAVEAARAGEQGRGFAVVASEVRSLAQRSAVAAKEVKELIGSSVATIQNGAQQATEVGATMADVKQAIKQVSDIVGEIAAASEEQSRGIEQVNQAVNQMDEVTQQNAALVEQAAAAAQSLEEQAMNLTGVVSVFKLADVELPASRVSASLNKPRLSTTKPRNPQRMALAKFPAASAHKPPVVADKQAQDSFNADWQTF
ncbi:MAG TPA: methyl-accepting chemotaxis protein [Paraburkholderia sp.]|uniref:methyl-accepting chemotaxis protein n=1 Tax=Paraburkholderia sp. TaxID=1926495 RepID=UPI002B490FE1|nr:methyl-accepting chemotaxis protein [Paraburkholderia sp.]HKR45658.1 methyl-accepting chemotaxis protein [Paraburkholderia sp.]